jgi:hypothetical protein
MSSAISPLTKAYVKYCIELDEPEKLRGSWEILLGGAACLSAPRVSKLIGEYAGIAKNVVYPAAHIYLQGRFSSKALGRLVGIDIYRFIQLPVVDPRCVRALFQRIKQNPEKYLEIRACFNLEARSHSVVKSLYEGKWTILYFSHADIYKDDKEIHSTVKLCTHLFHAGGSESGDRLEAAVIAEYRDKNGKNIKADYCPKISTSVDSGIAKLQESDAALRPYHLFNETAATGT